jgi:hypothetical protein
VDKVRAVFEESVERAGPVAEEPETPEPVRVQGETAAEAETPGHALVLREHFPAERASSSP